MLDTNSSQLFEQQVDALVRDINCVGVSANQAAKQFDEAFPENAHKVQAAFERGEIEPATPVVVDRGVANSPRYIFNLPTRVHWKAPLTTERLNAGVEAIVAASLKLGISTLAIQRFAEPNPAGPIHWDQIKLAFLTSFARVPKIRLVFLNNGLEATPPKQVTIFSDGGAEPNPGIGGYGIVLRFGDSAKELSAGYQATTNNRMELLAAIVGLETLKETCSVRLYSDSRYIVDMVETGAVFRWREKNWKNGKTKNADLWERFVIAYVKHDVEMVWVKGHAGIADNERCDRLASQAMLSNQLEVDEGYLEIIKPSGVQTKQETSADADSRSALKNKPRGPKPKQIGDPCRNCATPLVAARPKRATRIPPITTPGICIAPDATGYSTSKQRKSIVRKIRLDWFSKQSARPSSPSCQFRIQRPGRFPQTRVSARDRG